MGSDFSSPAEDFGVNRPYWTWDEALYLIIVWTGVGETFFEKNEILCIDWRSAPGVKNLSWTRGSMLNMVP